MKSYLPSLLSMVLALGTALFAQDNLVSVNPLSFPGVDLGAKINAVQASTVCSTACIIQIPPGRYEICSQIILAKPGISLISDARGAAKLVMMFTKGDFIKVISDNVEIAGFTVESNAKAVGYSSIHVVGASFVHIHNNFFVDSRSPKSNTYIGVRVEGSASMAADNADIHNNVFKSMPWIGVSVACNANYSDVHHNKFLNGGEAFDFNGAKCDSTNNSFTDNWIIGGTGASFLESVSAATVKRNHFIDAGTVSTDTIYIHLALGPNSTRSEISDNDFYGTENTRSALNIYDNTTNIVVGNNTIRNYGADGVVLATAAGSIQDIDLKGNVITDNGQWGAGYCGIRISQINGHPVDRIFFFDNRIGGSAGHSGQEKAVCVVGPTPPGSMFFVGNYLNGGTKFDAGCARCKFEANLE
jgi:hypothetical protein